MAELKRLAREAATFPTANEVAVSEGGTSSVTDELRNAVAFAAGRLGVATRNAVDSSNDTQETIRQAVMMVAEQDAAIADDSKLIRSLLGSAVAQSGTDTSAEADLLMRRGALPTFSLVASIAAGDASACCRRRSDAGVGSVVVRPARFRRPRDHARWNERDVTRD